MSEYTRYSAIKHRVERAESLQSNLCDIHDISVSDCRYLLNMIELAIIDASMEPEASVNKISPVEIRLYIEERIIEDLES